MVFDGILNFKKDHNLRYTIEDAAGGKKHVAMNIIKDDGTELAAELDLDKVEYEDHIPASGNTAMDAARVFIDWGNIVTMYCVDDDGTLIIDVYLFDHVNRELYYAPMVLEEV